MGYCEHQLGFVIAYLGHDIREIEEKEESEDWFSLYSSIPVLENIGIDNITMDILDKFGITLSDLSRAYNEIVTTDFSNMFNNVFIST